MKDEKEPAVLALIHPSSLLWGASHPSHPANSSMLISSDSSQCCWGSVEIRNSFEVIK